MLRLTGHIEHFPPEAEAPVTGLKSPLVMQEGPGGMLGPGARDQ